MEQVLPARYDRIRSSVAIAMPFASLANIIFLMDLSITSLGWHLFFIQLERFRFMVTALRFAVCYKEWANTPSAVKRY